MGNSPHIPKYDNGDVGTVSSHGQAIPSPGAEMQVVPAREKKGGSVIYISSEAIGNGDPPQSGSLMHSFLYTLTEIAPQPKAIILVGSAVRLARPGSAAIESLSLMQEQGVQILVAEKSLREIEDEAGIAVGKPVTMHAILNELLQAEKVISL